MSAAFPLQLHAFAGNKAETLTLVPVLYAFKVQHPHVTVSVACDAGMLSAANLVALENSGYSFIVGPGSRKPRTISPNSKTMAEPLKTIKCLK